jgi:hypothetical protein
LGGKTTTTTQPSLRRPKQYENNIKEPPTKKRNKKKKKPYITKKKKKKTETIRTKVLKDENPEFQRQKQRTKIVYLHKELHLLAQKTKNKKSLTFYQPPSWSATW